MIRGSSRPTRVFIPLAFHHFFAKRFTKVTLGRISSSVIKTCLYICPIDVYVVYFLKSLSFASRMIFDSVRRPLSIEHLPVPTLHPLPCRQCHTNLLLVNISLRDLFVHIASTLVMGPAINPFRRPSHSIFSWNIRICLWEDGRENREPCATIVKMKSTYHDALQDAHSNKILKSSRGVTLPAQIFGRAVDLCGSISFEIFHSGNKKDAIVKCLYICDPMYAVSHQFDDFSILADTKCQRNKLFKNFDSCFAAQLV